MEPRLSGRGRKDDTVLTFDLWLLQWSRAC